MRQKRKPIVIPYKALNEIHSCFNLGKNDIQDLELAVASLQEALFGLNRRLSAERRSDSNPLQGIRNTFGSLKDELFSDDYWDDDPWDNQMNRNYRNSRYGNSRDDDPWDNDYFL